MKNLIKRITTSALVAFGVAMLVVPGANVALADETAPVATEDVGGQFLISSPTWTIITGLLLPIVIGLITKASAHKGFQAVVGIIVAAIGAIVIRATTVDGAAVFDQALIVDAALVYIPQIAAYLGFWKNIDLNQKTLPQSGLG